MSDQEQVTETEIAPIRELFEYLELQYPKASVVLDLTEYHYGTSYIDFFWRISEDEDDDIDLTISYQIERKFEIDNLTEDKGFGDFGSPSYQTVVEAKLAIGYIIPTIK